MCLSAADWQTGLATAFCLTGTCIPKLTEPTCPQTLAWVWVWLGTVLIDTFVH